MPFYRPYSEDIVNQLYNLLFCDDPLLFKGLASGPLAVIFAKAFDEAAVRRIAEDSQAESRVRVLAFNRLRAGGAEVPRGLLLGAIAEVPQEGGLDTLAAYTDKRVRMINQTGKMAIIEQEAPPLLAPVDAFLEASRAVVRQIGPWTEARLAPPKYGNVRLSFLCSDGLYLGEGPFNDIARDALGGPVLQAGGALLAAVVDFVLTQQQR